MKIRTLAFLLLFAIISCDGTLGGFETRRFPISKQKLNSAFDTLFSKHPEYIIPDKWKSYDVWGYWGKNSLEARTFYLKSNPEEMYYVSFIGDEEMLKDTTHIDIAIRSVFTRRHLKWLKEEDCNDKEKERIEERFDREIISKLEEYTNVKAIRQN
ncbi:hypothetical protein [Flavobacterium sp. CAN_S2]|uniref:hypothetical protein n=1 Tax=Flavobacterium sp. CAN_S2 TaxID=2787726 RepID=UPI0018CBD75E